jgi:hypothetical protein
MRPIFLSATLKDSSDSDDLFVMNQTIEPAHKLKIPTELRN